MLDLRSPRWAELQHAFGSSGSIPDRLAIFIARPTDESGSLVDPSDLLYGSLCHQSLAVYTATYAALPHILDRAESLAPRRRLALLIFAGAVEAARKLSSASPPIPDDVEPSYSNGLRIAADLAHADLLVEWPVLEYRYLVGTFSALIGKQSFGRYVSNLDMYGDPHEWGESQT
jgi:hypothetical protein